MVKGERENAEISRQPLTADRGFFQPQVVLWEPRAGDVPHVDLVRAVLNAAAITKFKLNVSTVSVEGGISGWYKDDYIDLSNLTTSFGDESPEARAFWLVSEFPQQGTRPVDEILDFYAEMLRLLFADGFEINGVPVKPWNTEESAALSRETVWQTLIAMLINIEGAGFAQEVINTISKLRPNEQAALRGLTDGEIKKWVGPPL